MSSHDIDYSLSNQPRSTGTFIVDNVGFSSSSFKKINFMKEVVCMWRT